MKWDDAENNARPVGDNSTLVQRCENGVLFQQQKPGIWRPVFALVVGHLTDGGPLYGEYHGLDGVYFNYLTVLTSENVDSGQTGSLVKNEEITMKTMPGAAEGAQEADVEIKDLLAPWDEIPEDVAKKSKGLVVASQAVTRRRDSPVSSTARYGHGPLRPGDFTRETGKLAVIASGTSSRFEVNEEFMPSRLNSPAYKHEVC